MYTSTQNMSFILLRFLMYLPELFSLKIEGEDAILRIFALKMEHIINATVFDRLFIWPLYCIWAKLISAIFMEVILILTFSGTVRHLPSIKAKFARAKSMVSRIVDALRSPSSDFNLLVLFRESLLWNHLGRPRSQPPTSFCAPPKVGHKPVFRRGAFSRVYHLYW